MKHLFGDDIRKFDTLTLKELDAPASLLDREEKKYTLTPERFSELIPELIKTFRILKIGNKRIFSYRSFYFDSDKLVGYTYHIQNRLKGRFRIRTRHYVDSGLCFFEVKLKTKRGGTIKRRIRYDLKDYGKITPHAKDFLQTVYRETYGVPFTHDLLAKLEVNCDRITLVHKESSERMTIDFNLNFSSRNKSSPIKRFVIIETKSQRGKGVADSIFKINHIRSRSISKYCLGVNLLFDGVKYNCFKPLLKLYNNFPNYNAAMEDESVAHAGK